MVAQKVDVLNALRRAAPLTLEVRTIRQPYVNLRTRIVYTVAICNMILA